jgi:hypothetical protein
MAGRQKIKCFEYSEDGKYLREYGSIQEVREKFYIGDNGKRPLFRDNSGYFKTPIGTFIANHRIGRDKLMKSERLKNCPFCTYRTGIQDNKAFEIFNLKNEKIAEFKDVHKASLLLNLSYKNIWSRLNSISLSRKFTSRDNLVFKYK